MLLKYDRSGCDGLPLMWKTQILPMMWRASGLGYQKEDDYQRMLCSFSRAYINPISIPNILHLKTTIIFLFPKPFSLATHGRSVLLSPKSSQRNANVPPAVCQPRIAESKYTLVLTHVSWSRREQHQWGVKSVRRITKIVKKGTDGSHFCCQIIEDGDLCVRAYILHLNGNLLFELPVLFSLGYGYIDPPLLPSFLTHTC